MECIVHGCTNKKQDGMFFGGICAPCYEHLTTGVIGPTNSFLSGFYELRKYVKELGLNSNVCTIEKLIESHIILRTNNMRTREEINIIINKAREEAYKKAYEDYNRTELIHIDELEKMTIAEICELFPNKDY